MAADLGAIADGLFEGVMAPLVLGGAMRPVHAIGARAALALGDGERRTTDTDLEAHVQLGRVRRARRLVPVDTVERATAAEWALVAVLNDLLQAANPTFDAALRRRAALRILAVARETLERIPPPTDVREALSRHTWLARVLDVVRTDTAVSWWIGKRTYLGVEPPPRLQAWPELRRVSVVATPRPLLDLTPLAVDREALTEAVALLLARTPLTDLATCTRGTPKLVWHEATLGLVATAAGRTLALRAMARLPSADVDAALGRATHELLATRPDHAEAALSLLAERALAGAVVTQKGAQVTDGASDRPEIAFARGLGAAVAVRLLDRMPLPEPQRHEVAAALLEAARTPAALEGTRMLGARATTTTMTTTQTTTTTAPDDRGSP
jgi:hypothetical protein